MRGGKLLTLSTVWPGRESPHDKGTLSPDGSKWVSLSIFAEN